MSNLKFFLNTNVYLGLILFCLKLGNGQTTNKIDSLLQLLKNKVKIQPGLKHY